MWRLATMAKASELVQAFVGKSRSFNEVLAVSPRNKQNRLLSLGVGDALGAPEKDLLVTALRSRLKTGKSLTKFALGIRKRNDRDRAIDRKIAEESNPESIADFKGFLLDPKAVIDGVGIPRDQLTTRSQLLLDAASAQERSKLQGLRGKSVNSFEQTRAFAIAFGGDFGIAFGGLALEGNPDRDLGSDATDPSKIKSDPEKEAKRLRKIEKKNQRKENRGKILGKPDEQRQLRQRRGQQIIRNINRGITANLVGDKLGT